MKKIVSFALVVVLCLMMSAFAAPSPSKTADNVTITPNENVELVKADATTAPGAIAAAEAMVEALKTSDYSTVLAGAQNDILEAAGSIDGENIVVNDIVPLALDVKNVADTPITMKMDTKYLPNAKVAVVLTLVDANGNVIGTVVLNGQADATGEGVVFTIPADVMAQMAQSGVNCVATTLSTADSLAQ